MNNVARRFDDTWKRYASSQELAAAGEIAYLLSDINAGLSYKPNWELAVGFVYSSRVELELRIDVPVDDIRAFVRGKRAGIKASAQEVLHHQTNLGAVTDFTWFPQQRQRILEAIYQGILKLETHEIQEWLQVDGVHVIHPHPNGMTTI